MNKIRQIRKQNKLSIKALAEKAMVPYRTVQDWERGVRIPRDVYQIHKLAVALGVTIEEMIDFEEVNQ